MKTSQIKFLITLDKDKIPEKITWNADDKMGDEFSETKSIFNLDNHGFGTAIYEIIAGKEIYSLVCFSQFLDDKDRSDRVIASKWDTAYTLHQGKINNRDESMFFEY